MKQFKTLLLAAVLCLVTVSFAQAQSKIAHINAQELIQAMPEMKTARAELEALTKTYQKDLQTMGAEFQNKVKQYDAEASTKTQEENVNSIAKKVYNVLKLKGFSRSEYIFKGDTPYLLEINTIPGLTLESILPQQAAAAQIPLQDLFCNAIQEALKN